MAHVLIFWGVPWPGIALGGGCGRRQGTYARFDGQAGALSQGAVLRSRARFSALPLVAAFPPTPPCLILQLFVDVGVGGGSNPHKIFAEAARLAWSDNHVRTCHASHRVCGDLTSFRGLWPGTIRFSGIWFAGEQGRLLKIAFDPVVGREE